MKKWILITASIMISLALCHQAFASDIDNLFELPEKKIDIGIAALTFAKEIYPNLDIKAYSAKIDKLVGKVRAFTEGKADPLYRVAALNTYLYKTAKFEYDFSEIDNSKLENRYLNGILDTKKGTCVTMPLLYLAVAQRLGYPVYPVAAPDHLFLRYVDPKLKKQNIEATGGGGYSPDEVYKKDLEITEKGIKSGSYLRTLTYREFLADLLAQNGVYWGIRGDLTRAINYLEKATSINPKFADHYHLLARLYISLSRQSSNRELAEVYRDEAEMNFRKADELGFVRPSKEEYMKQVRKKAEEQFNNTNRRASK